MKKPNKYISNQVNLMNAQTESTLGCYNTDQILWNNYGRDASKSSPTGGVSVTIDKYGRVGNGRRLMAQFPSRRAAARTLKAAGFTITRALGCGHVKTNLSARYFQK